MGRRVRGRGRGTQGTTSRSAPCHPGSRPALLPRTVPWRAVAVPPPPFLARPAQGRPALLAYSHSCTRTSAGRHTGATRARPPPVPAACLPGRGPALSGRSAPPAGSRAPAPTGTASDPALPLSTAVRPPRTFPGNRPHGQREPLPLLLCRLSTPARTLESPPAAAGLPRCRVVPPGD